MLSSERILRSATWGGLEALARVAIQLGSLVVLARLLEPEDFGVAAIVTALLFWLNLVVEQGFAGALVQREDLREEHVHSAFWAALASGTLLYAGAWFAAPLLAAWSSTPGLAALLRTCCLALFLSAPHGVLVARLRRELRFRELALATSTGRIGGAFVAVVMALSGAGVWSLIGQRLGTYAVGLVVLALHSSWRPRLVFSLRRLRELGGFAVQSLAGDVAYVGVNQLFLLLVGSFFGAAGLGYFNVACRVTASLSSVLESAVRQITLPVLARQQGDRSLLIRSVYTTGQLCCVLAAPVFLGLLVVAPEVVVGFIGEKWLPAVPLVRLVCLGCLCYFAQIALDSALDAIGRPAWRLLVVALELAVLVGLLLPERGGALLAIGVASFAARALATPATFLVLRRFLPLEGRTLLRGYAGPVLSAGVMMAVVQLNRVLLTGWLGPATWPLLIGSVALGAVAYALCLRLIAPALFASLVDYGARILRPRSSP